MSDQTFLLADLAGFTALTELHGDDYGADLAGDFCDVLNERLPDGAEDFKMLGDACLVRVTEAADAVALALELTTNIDERFPPVRVGMHTGPAVRRGSDWYGTTLNTAVRVAEMARADEVLLTGATRTAAAGVAAVRFDDLGERSLRNLNTTHRLYRAVRLPFRAEL